MMPSFKSLCTSLSIKSKSSRLYRPDLVAIGCQLGDKLAKGSGGDMFKVLNPQTDKGGSGCK